MEEIQKMLSADECSLILYRYLKQDGLKVDTHQIASLSDKIEGFLGEHFVVTIKYQKEGAPKVLRCFMKVLNGTMKTIFEMSLALNAYEKEEFFYTYLLKKLEAYGIDVSFAPEGYFCKPYLIVLEDLSLRGFKGGPKDNSMDLDHCKVSLRTLAKFHASSILYETRKSEEFGEPYSLVDVHPTMFKEMMFAEETNIAKQWLYNSMLGIYSLIELIPENHVNKIDFVNKLNHLVQGAPELIHSLRKYKCSFLHGDLWSNNFLFKYESEVPQEAILLDYQFLKYGPPSLDVLHLIFCNTRKSFRDKHFTYLIEYYYKCLIECLPNIEPEKAFPRGEYLQLCDDLQSLIKLLCLSDRCITFAPEEVVAENIVSDEALRRYFLEERAKAILTCFNHGAAYKEVITEDIVELRDMLFKNS